MSRNKRTPNVRLAIRKDTLDSDIRSFMGWIHPGAFGSIILFLATLCSGIAGSLLLYSESVSISGGEAMLYSVVFLFAVALGYVDIEVRKRARVAMENTVGEGKGKAVWLSVIRSSGIKPATGMIMLMLNLVTFNGVYLVMALRSALEGTAFVSHPTTFFLLMTSLFSVAALFKYTGHYCDLKRIDKDNLTVLIDN